MLNRDETLIRPTPCTAAAWRGDAVMCELADVVSASLDGGWDNAEHGSTGATLAVDRGNPTPADRFTAYPTGPFMKLCANDGR